MTPLHVAAANNQMGCAEALVLEFGAAVDARAGNGATPLFLAASRGHAEVVRRLAGLRGDPNAAGKGLAWLRPVENSSSLCWAGYTVMYCAALRCIVLCVLVCCVVLCYVALWCAVLCRLGCAGCAGCMYYAVLCCVDVLCWCCVVLIGCVVCAVL
jgi:hypothetical protein